MKTIKTKLSWSIFGLIIITLFSCNEKENQDVIENNQNQEQYESVVTESPIKKGVFVKSYELNSNNSHYVIEVSTNNEEIFKAIKKNGINNKLLTHDDYLKNKENYKKEHEFKNEKEEISIKNSDEHFVTIETKVIERNENQLLNITLSDNLLASMKKFDAKTIGTTINMDSKGVEYTGRQEKYFFRGDGTQTKVRLYYKYRDGRNRYFTTRNGFKNFYEFVVCDWPFADYTRCYYYAWELISGRVASVFPDDISYCNEC